MRRGRRKQSKCSSETPSPSFLQALEAQRASLALQPPLPPPPLPPPPSNLDLLPSKPRRPTLLSLAFSRTLSRPGHTSFGSLASSALLRRSLLTLEGFQTNRFPTPSLTPSIFISMKMGLRGTLCVYSDSELHVLQEGRSTWIQLRSFLDRRHFLSPGSAVLHEGGGYKNTLLAATFSSSTGTGSVPKHGVDVYTLRQRAVRGGSSSSPSRLVFSEEVEGELSWLGGEGEVEGSTDTSLPSLLIPLGKGRVCCAVPGESDFKAHSFWQGPKPNSSTQPAPVLVTCPFPSSSSSSSTTTALLATRNGAVYSWDTRAPGGGATSTTSALFKLALAPLCLSSAPTVSPWAVLGGDFEGTVSVFDVRRCGTGGGGGKALTSTTPLFQVVQGGVEKGRGKFKVKFQGSSGVGVIKSGRGEGSPTTSHPHSFQPFFVGHGQEGGAGEGRVDLSLPAMPYLFGDSNFDIVLFPSEAVSRNWGAGRRGKSRSPLIPTFLALDIVTSQFSGQRYGWNILQPPLCGIEEVED